MAIEISQMVRRYTPLGLHHTRHKTIDWYNVLANSIILSFSFFFLDFFFYFLSSSAVLTGAQASLCPRIRLFMPGKRGEIPVIANQQLPAWLQTGGPSGRNADINSPLHPPARMLISTRPYIQLPCPYSKYCWCQLLNRTTIARQKPRRMCS